MYVFIFNFFQNADDSVISAGAESDASEESYFSGLEEEDGSSDEDLEMVCACIYKHYLLYLSTHYLSKLVREVRNFNIADLKLNRPQHFW